MSKTFYFLLTFILTANLLFAQGHLSVKEDESMAEKYKSRLKSGSALLIFKSQLDLTFDSSVENLNQPANENGYYFLYVNPGPQSISVTYDYTQTKLNFGMFTPSNSYSSLKANDIKFFDVFLKAELEYSDITSSELKRGNFKIPVGPNVSDALVVLRLFPTDLEIKISEENNLISRISKEGTSYNVFLKMPGNKSNFKNYRLLITDADNESINIDVFGLGSKEVRFYRVKKPIISEVSQNVSATNKLNYEKNVLGYWGGNIGNDKGFIDFQDLDVENSKISGKVVFEGDYYAISGVIKFLNDKEYSVTLNKKSNSGMRDATIDLTYKMGIMQGLMIDNKGNVFDCSLMRTQTIPEDKSSAKIADYNNRKLLLMGDWYFSDNKYFKSINIVDLSNNDIITGEIIFNDSKRFKFSTKANLLKNFTGTSIKIPDNYPQFSGVLIANFDNTGNTKSTFISNDGTTTFNTTLSKSLISNKEKTIDISKKATYVANKPKVYFYNTPNLNDRRNGYIIEGQSPNVLSSHGDFFYVEFTYNNSVTKGYMLKLDLKSETLTSSTTNHTSSNINYAIINDSEGWVYLRSQPSTGSPFISSINKGEKVEILEKTGNWYKVKYKNQSGFIYFDRLKIL
jgi:hypothetical protein